MIYYDNHRFYSLEETMKKTELSRDTVRYHIANKDFHGIVEKGRTYVLAKDVHEFINARKNYRIRKVNANPKGNCTLSIWVPKSLYKRVVMLANDKTKGSVSKLVLPLLERTYGGK